MQFCLLLMKCTVELLVLIYGGGAMCKNDGWCMNEIVIRLKYYVVVS